MPFPTLGELSRIITQPVDPGLVPAAFQNAIGTLMARRKMEQQQAQFDAELAQQQQQFDTTEGRLWHEQAAQEGVGYARIGEQNRHNLAAEQQKRREAQSAAAKTVGEALSSGRTDVVEAMKPYLQSLGVTAEMVEAPPQLSAFAQPGVDMNFSLGRRSLRLSADGQPLGDVDIDRIAGEHRAAVDPMLQNLIAGAQPEERQAYQTMADAARSSPEMMGQPAHEVFKTVTGAAQAAAGQQYQNERAKLLRDAAVGARTSSADRAERDHEFQRQKYITAQRDKHVTQAMQIADQKGLIKDERAANQAIANLDAAIKSGTTLEGSAAARLTVGKIVRALYGAQSSNRELQSIWAMSFGSDAENKLNYFTGGGAIDPAQLQALRGVMQQSVQQLRGSRRQLADETRQRIWGDSALTGIVGDPAQLEALGNDGARVVLGAGNVPPPTQSIEPEISGGALENEAEQADEADPAIDEFLGDWNP